MYKYNGYYTNSILATITNNLNNNCVVFNDCLLAIGIWIVIWITWTAIQYWTGEYIINDVMWLLGQIWWLLLHFRHQWTVITIIGSFVTHLVVSR